MSGVNRYCVYSHTRLDTNEIFYIGLGIKTRPYSKHNRNLLWKRITSKTEYKIEIIKDQLTLEDACNLEKQLIKKYGRIDLSTGTLCNFTDGGEGSCNRICKEETKLKRSKAMSKIKRDDVWKKNISEGLKGKKLTDEHKQNLSKAKKGKKLSKKHIENIIKSSKNKVNPQAKKIIDISTNKIFKSIRKAADFIGISPSTLRAKLSGQNKNNTTLRYLKNDK